VPLVIPKQPKKERDQITIRLDRDVLQNLEHYCRYLESRRDYVINQCLAFNFRKDKPLAMWLADQGISTPAETNGAAAQPKSLSQRNASHNRRPFRSGSPLLRRRRSDPSDSRP
jgi:hypothetical protein